VGHQPQGQHRHLLSINATTATSPLHCPVENQPVLQCHKLQWQHACIELQHGSMLCNNKMALFKPVRHAINRHCWHLWHFVLQGVGAINLNNDIIACHHWILCDSTAAMQTSLAIVTPLLLFALLNNPPVQQPVELQQQHIASAAALLCNKTSWVRVLACVPQLVADGQCHC